MVELHMNLLADKLNLGELEDSLRNLPDEVDKTYEQALQRINDYSANRKELAMKVLMWVACSVERLSARAIQHVLATKSGKFDEKYLTPLSTITAACAGLIVVQNEGFWNENLTVRFVREYCPAIACVCDVQTCFFYLRLYNARVFQ
jgi:phosphate uptake regulator